MASVGESVQERRRHFRVTEDAGPFTKAQIGRNYDTGSLVELGQQVKEQRSS
jgi:hypothetical protein